MWRPSTSNGSLVWLGAGRQAALREVVAVQRARDHAGLARAGRRSCCSRSASQAPPDQMPTRRGVGLEQAAHAGEQLGVERFGVELSRLRHRAGSASKDSLQELLEDDRRGRGVEVARAVGAAPRSCV